MAINNGLKLCWLSTNCPVARARKEPRKSTAKDSICMRYVNNKFGPLAGQHFWGARIKNQSPKRVTDYSRTRHVRVRVICIWMVWLLRMAGGESGTVQQEQDTAAKAAAWGNSSIVILLSLFVAALTGVWLERKQRLLWRQHCCWYVESVYGTAQRGNRVKDAVWRWFRYHQTCCSSGEQGKVGRHRFACAHLNLSACALFVPLSNGFIISMTADPFRRLAASLTYGQGKAPLKWACAVPWRALSQCF